MLDTERGQARVALMRLAETSVDALVVELGEYGCGLRYRPASDDWRDFESVEEGWEVYEFEEHTDRVSIVADGPTAFTACINALLNLLGWEDGTCVRGEGRPIETADMDELRAAIAAAERFIEEHQIEVTESAAGLTGRER